MFGPDQIIGCLTADVSGWTADQVAEGLRDVARVRAALDGCEARLLAVFAAAGKTSLGGSADVASWLRSNTGVSHREASRRAASARELARLPAVGEALSTGRVSGEHAAALARAVQSCPAVGDHVDGLVALAEQLPADAFDKEVRAFAQGHQPDGGAAQSERLHARRRAASFTTDDGMIGLDVRLDPVAGAEVTGLLDQVSEELWRADQPDASGVAARELSSATRRADALVEIFRRASSNRLRVGKGDSPATESPRRPAPPTLLVLLDHQALSGQIAAHPVSELLDGTPLPPATARRLACDARIVPIVLGGSSVPLDLGRARRSPTHAQRTALVVRDRCCVFPGCDRPPAWCDVHHLLPWDTGGSTDLVNLVLLCEHHHHLVHEGGWQLRRAADGTIEARAPDGTLRASGPRQDRRLETVGAPAGAGQELELAWAGAPS
jgi:hypothetical protein